MKITHIPFQKTGFFSKTMIDYLNNDKKIKSFYNNFPDLEGFKKQINEKKFSQESRELLVSSLKKQYEGFNISDKTMQNIDVLKQKNSFTVVTGHQLNLFSGPLYFLYKIISTINLCEELSEKFPDNKFVPIYWMATEDHDFEEINYFNFKGTKVVWNREDGGPVGRFSLDGLEDVFVEFSEYLGTSSNASFLKNLFEETYVKQDNLADATRYLANELFKEYGLVILDGDDIGLKSEFAPHIKTELLHKKTFKEVEKTIETLESNYKIQVTPREINLFYIKDNLRKRIVFEDDVYKINDTNIKFSEKEILEELKSNPERLSPNVILRPLYQEVILPNLCYIGGGGELAYWLELKSSFEVNGIAFPILLLRNSVLVISEKQSRKLNKLRISVEDIFQKQNELLKLKITENSNINFSFSGAKTLLEQQFSALQRVAEQTDYSFVGAVNAQQAKQLKGLLNLEKRLLRAEKRKQSDLVNRIIKLQNQLFPNQSLEERQRNFSEYYLEYGEHFIKSLKEGLKPLQLEFTVLEL